MCYWVCLVSWGVGSKAIYPRPATDFAGGAGCHPHSGRFGASLWFSCRYGLRVHLLDQGRFGLARVVGIVWTNMGRRIWFDSVAYKTKRK